jgi:two-component system cell cycle sensor histidine kinase/response regulator CckA
VYSLVANEPPALSAFRGGQNASAMMEAESDNSLPSRRLLRALILEDDPADVELLVGTLQRVGYPLSHDLAESPEQFAQQLEKAEYDVILADYNLRTWTAMDALEVLKKSGRDVPFVVVTGTLGDEAVVECIKQGATDYVLKHRLQRLLVVVDRALRDKAHREEAARLQEQILRAKKEWEVTFDAIPGAVFVLDEQHCIQRANRAAAALLGLQTSQLIGKYCCEVLGDTAGPLPGSPFRRMLRTGKEERCDIEVARLGKVLDVTASPLFDSSRTAYGSVHVLHDITDRKREEEALRRSEASYRSLILGATYGIFRCDVNGKFLAVNPALVAMLAYDSEADLLTANLVRDVIRDPEEGVRLLQQYRQRGRLDGVEARWRRKDGTPVQVRLSGRTVLDEHGALQGFEVIAEDVSERRGLEEQLRQAQKMEAVGRLAGGVAHDFSNLLTIITGYSQLLLDRLGSDDQLRGYVSEVLNAGDRAASLTCQLLAFSRRQVLQAQVLDLNTILANIDKMVRRLIREDVELVTHREPDLGRVKADPGQIEQVIMNLAVNARDAMPQGGQLTLETANVELNEGYACSHESVLPGRFVMLAVSDSGIGIDAETQAHIFEPFFTTKGTRKGTGLGLATVYGIVKQSGGHIWLYSEPNHGITFKIYLPLVEEVTQPVAAISPGAPLAGGSETILLVEDEEGVRDLARRILELKGYKVITASNPTEAAQVCGRHEGPIHLLLTDVIMPTMSGRQLAEHVAFLRPELKVLYMSGYTDNAIVPHGILEEGVQFLQKPFAPNLLIRRVREALEAPQQAA